MEGSRARIPRNRGRAACHRLIVRDEPPSVVVDDGLRLSRVAYIRRPRVHHTTHVMFEGSLPAGGGPASPQSPPTSLGGSAPTSPSSHHHSHQPPPPPPPPVVATIGGFRCTSQHSNSPCPQLFALPHPGTTCDDVLLHPATPPSAAPASQQALSSSPSSDPFPIQARDGILLKLPFKISSHASARIDARRVAVIGGWCTEGMLRTVLLLTFHWGPLERGAPKTQLHHHPHPHQHHDAADGGDSGVASPTSAASPPPAVSYGFSLTTDVVSQRQRHSTQVARHPIPRMMHSACKTTVQDRDLIVVFGGITVAVGAEQPPDGSLTPFSTAPSSAATVVATGATGVAGHAGDEDGSGVSASSGQAAHGGEAGGTTSSAQHAPLSQNMLLCSVLEFFDATALATASAVVNVEYHVKNADAGPPPRCSAAMTTLPFSAANPEMGMLAVGGGLGARSEILGDLWVLTPSSSQLSTLSFLWREVATPAGGCPLPRRIGHTMVAVHPGKVVVVGGCHTISGVPASDEPPSLQTALLVEVAMQQQPQQEQQAAGRPQLAGAARILAADRILPGASIAWHASAVSRSPVANGGVTLWCWGGVAGNGLASEHLKACLPAIKYELFDVTQHRKLLASAGALAILAVAAAGLAAPPASPPVEPLTKAYTLKLSHAAEQLGLQYDSVRGTPGNGDEGVVITVVEPEWPGERAGVPEGVVVKSLNGHQVGNEDDLFEAVRRMRDQASLEAELVVWRSTAAAGLLPSPPLSHRRMETEDDVAEEDEAATATATATTTTTTTTTSSRSVHPTRRASATAAPAQCASASCAYAVSGAGDSFCCGRCRKAPGSHGPRCRRRPYLAVRGSGSSSSGSSAASWTESNRSLHSRGGGKGPCPLRDTLASVDSLADDTGGSVSTASTARMVRSPQPTDGGGAVTAALRKQALRSEARKKGDAATSPSSPNKKIGASLGRSPAGSLVTPYGVLTGQSLQSLRDEVASEYQASVRQNEAAAAATAAAVSSVSDVESPKLSHEISIVSEEEVHTRLPPPPPPSPPTRPRSVGVAPVEGDASVSSGCMGLSSVLGGSSPSLVPKGVSQLLRQTTKAVTDTLSPLHQRVMDSLITGGDLATPPASGLASTSAAAAAAAVRSPVPVAPPVITVREEEVRSSSSSSSVSSDAEAAAAAAAASGVEVTVVKEEQHSPPQLPPVAAVPSAEALAAAADAIELRAQSSSSSSSSSSSAAAAGAAATASPRPAAMDSFPSFPSVDASSHLYEPDDGVRGGGGGRADEDFGGLMNKRQMARDELAVRYRMFLPKEARSQNNMLNDDLGKSVTRGDDQKVILLLMAGADPVVRLRSWAMLAHAAYAAQPKNVRALLEYGAEVDTQCEKRYTPLHHAADVGCSETASVLLEHGADPLLCDVRQRNALSWAAAQGRLEVVRLLLQHSRHDVNHAGDEGRTALHYAAGTPINRAGGRANSDHAACVALLLEYGAAADRVSLDGNTALMDAAQGGEPEQAACVRELVGSGKCDPNQLRRSDGATAAILSARHGHIAVTRILEEAGTDMSIVDARGHTAGDYCSIAYLKGVVQKPHAQVSFQPQLETRPPNERGGGCDPSRAELAQEAASTAGPLQAGPASPAMRGGGAGGGCDISRVESDMYFTTLHPSHSSGARSVTSGTSDSVSLRVESTLSGEAVAAAAAAPAAAPPAQPPRAISSPAVGPSIRVKAVLKNLTEEGSKSTLSFTIKQDEDWASFVDVLLSNCRPVLADGTVYAGVVTSASLLQSSRLFWLDEDGDSIALSSSVHYGNFIEHCMDATKPSGKIEVVLRADAVTSAAAAQTPPPAALGSPPRVENDTRPLTPPPAAHAHAADGGGSGGVGGVPKRASVGQDSLGAGSSVSGGGASSTSTGKSKISWTIGDLVGKGSFGYVYKALEHGTGRTWAVKKIYLDERDGRGSELEREVNVLKKLNHPNIVRFVGVERHPQYVYILMEYMSGGSLAAMARQFGREGRGLNISTIQGYTAQILSGLKYLHDCNIVHRDVKGDNILVDKDGNCKLSDFGASKILNNASVVCASGIRGTILFFAPEVLLFTQAHTHNTPRSSSHHHHPCRLSATHTTPTPLTSGPLGVRSSKCRQAGLPGTHG